MNHIDVYLTKYTHALVSPERVKKDIALIVGIALGTSLESENIRVSRGSLFITAHPALRTELALRREEILAAIQPILRGSREMRETLQ